MYTEDVGISQRIAAAARGDMGHGFVKVIVRLGPTASLTTAPYRVGSNSRGRLSYVGNLVEKSGMRWIHYLIRCSM